MKLSSFSNSFRVKIFVITLLICIAIGSFAYTQYLIIKIRENERQSIELWAKAMEYTSSPQYPVTRNQLGQVMDEIQNHPLLANDTKLRWTAVLQRANSDLSNAALDFIANEFIINNRFEIPSIGVDENQNILHHRNISEQNLDTDLIDKYAALNEPIVIFVGDEDNPSSIQYFYYGESAIVQTLKLFPYIQFGLLALFLGLGYASLSSIKRNEQSSLWVGMARESAHQLGTPISSLMGWTALLKDSLKDESNLNTIHELEKDIVRLQSIAERFNKIGSEPELKQMRVGPVLANVAEYMQRRMPQLNQSGRLFSDIDMDARSEINEELFKWAIENLIKNAIDASTESQKDFYVKVTSRYESGKILIDLEDNGRGIEKKNFKEIFSPGFSTKKRGWGLGLSLARRIVEEYHKGSIYVHTSEPGKGTTFRIELPVSRNVELDTV